jgi:hypothetical protein
MAGGCREVFFRAVEQAMAPRILELGTKRSDPARSTSHKVELLSVNQGVTHVGIDMEAGQDVDLVVDAHHLTERLPHASFDAFLAASVFEHLRWPWLAALELNAVLRVGGFGYVQSHHTFPLHGYPNDYWRFSVEAWGSLFCPETGWEVLQVDYAFPCRVEPADPIPAWSAEHTAYLNSHCYVRKIADVPPERFRWPVSPGAAARHPTHYDRWWYSLYRPFAPFVPARLRRAGRVLYEE